MVVFILRVFVSADRWRAGLHGDVRQVSSGATETFRNGDELVAQVARMLGNDCGRELAELRVNVPGSRSPHALASACANDRKDDASSKNRLPAIHRGHYIRATRNGDDAEPARLQTSQPTAGADGGNGRVAAEKGETS